MEATALEAGMAQRAVVFILSEIRSGSMYLSYVLASHPGVAHLGEYRRPFTIPGHVACRLCEARGKVECEILHGIEKVPRELAYDFAFERFQVPILIDSSKLLDWTAQFLAQDRFQVKVIHLLRDPRGWFASERRRNPMTLDFAIQRWVDTNSRIADFVAEHRIASRSVFYDDLAARPERYFPPLCDFVGVRYDSRAREYWNHEHHGLGGNGAALNLIGRYERANVITGDDQFYTARAQQHFHDTRWVAQLSRRERRTIERSMAIRLALQRHERSFSHFDALLADAGAPTALGRLRRAAARLLGRSPKS